MILFLKLTFKQLFYFFTTPQHRRFIWLILRYSGKKRYNPVHINVGGLRMHLPDAPSFAWQYRDIFAQQNYFFQTENPEPVILDCGANVGSSVLFFKKIFPSAKITAFEADPEICRFLHENVEKNGASDVKIVDAAVWINQDGIEIASEGADGAGIFAEGTKKRVNSVRLRDYLLAEKSVDMLKIDIEGAEYEVMRDCAGALGGVKHIFIEFHAYTGQPQRLAEILNVLQGDGFRYFIRPEADRTQPFVNRSTRYNPLMDLQLNIFAYKQ